MSEQVAGMNTVLILRLQSLSGSPKNKMLSSLGIQRMMLKLKHLNTTMETSHRSSGIKKEIHMLKKETPCSSLKQEYALSVTM